MLEEATYDTQRPFRINANLPPGALTARMAVPWQADFNDCSIEDGRGLVARPASESRCGAVRSACAVDARDWEHQDMVEKWAQLGFVVAKNVGEQSGVCRR